ncbi:MAG: DNA polymerase I, partial [Bacteroidales bacterium]|nr:DNA polymerase I [Candidatus Equibacterium intestinale]
PRQIGLLLFEKLNLDPKVKKNRNGSYPTDEETLQGIADKHPVVDMILEYRGLKKLLSTYIAPFPGYINPKDGRVHTTFTQALTATGRLSSVKPNLQNIPIRSSLGQEIRKAFVPGADCIVAADYSQIELRIMAHLSGDGTLVEEFRKGDDIHAATAAKIYGVPVEEVTKDQRRYAKTANFGIMYGISSFGLAQRIGISRSDAKKLIDDYFTSFPGVRRYIDKTVGEAREKGYVETLFGRRRYLPDINSRDHTVRSLAERNAVNAPIQGGSADIIKMAMIAINRRMKEEGFRSRMVLQIHDELLFDTYNDEKEALMELVKKEMQEICQLSVPLIVDCNAGENWLEAH